MKTLSVKNPFAFLICVGVKDVENRTWKTNYRGKILIHVPSRNYDPADISELLSLKQIYNLAGKGIKPEQHELCSKKRASCIIGTAVLKDCVQDSNSLWAERDCWHWIMENPMLFDKPIENVKGKLGLWDYDEL